MRRIREQLDRLELAHLGEPSARRLTVAQLASSVGDGVVLAALPFAILAAGGSIGQVGLALAVQALTMAGLCLPAGVLGDRFDRRYVLGAITLAAVGAELALIGCAAVLLLAMSLVVANPTIRALGVADGGSRDNADFLFVAPGSVHR